MAKCIRVVGQGVPARMSNEEAFQWVIRDKDGEYCSKDFYKKWHKLGRFADAEARDA